MGQWKRERVSQQYSNSNIVYAGPSEKSRENAVARDTRSPGFSEQQFHCAREHNATSLKIIHLTTMPRLSTNFALFAKMQR